MPLIRFPTVKGLVYTIDLSKIADRENPRTVEAPFYTYAYDPNNTFYIDWGDGNKSEMGSTQQTFEAFKEHTYAPGSGDIFTVRITSKTGYLPRIRVNDSTQTGQDTNPNKNIQFAIISLDHFNGFTGGNTYYAITDAFHWAKNLKYVDTRIAGQWTIESMGNWFASTGIDQPLESFCFDFCDGLVSIVGALRDNELSGNIPNGMFRNCPLTKMDSVFSDCSKIEGKIPEGLVDNATGLQSLGFAFARCTNLTAPYKFWEHTNAENFTQVVGVYNGCSNTLRSQAPTIYGGTVASWEAKGYTEGTKVFYSPNNNTAGKIYQATAAASAEDIPGTSAVWEPV